MTKKTELYYGNVDSCPLVDSHHPEPPRTKNVGHSSTATGGVRLKSTGSSNRTSTNPFRVIYNIIYIRTSQNISKQIYRMMILWPIPRYLAHHVAGEMAPFLQQNHFLPLNGSTWSSRSGPGTKKVGFLAGFQRLQRWDHLRPAADPDFSFPYLSHWNTRVDRLLWGLYYRV